MAPPPRTTVTALDPPGPAGASSRLVYLDHLRATLVLLVVLHHVAVVYGEGVSFYYVEPPPRDSLTYLAGLVFVLVNQAWFMGALFLLAGYFTPAAFDRKGPAAFLRERALRLGVPLLVYVFGLSPAIGFYLDATVRPAAAPVWQRYGAYLGLGPLWFVALLLVFSGGYAAWRWLRVARPVAPAPLPGYRAIAAFVVALALVSFVLRLWLPMGRFLLGFPTLCYLPQYLAFYVLGVVASRSGWLDALPKSMGVAGGVTAAVAFLLLFPPALITGPFWGGWHWQALVYALWDATFAVGVCLAVLPLFRRYGNKPGRLGGFLARHSYGVYVLHAPLVAAAAVTLRGLPVGNALKFGLVAALVVPASYAVAALVRRLPVAARVL